MELCPKCGGELANDGLCGICLLAGGYDVEADPDSAISEAVTQPAHGSHVSLAYDSFGPYRILRAIGEGGMGVVYLAEQTRPIRRQVALKVVKPGMDTQQILSRFNYERQALALMDHPNIAQVYDADATEKGRPYFVMEYIDGLPITEYCDGHRLNTEERLQLILPICQALQHAHQKGVLHRDIKPSNLLVKEQDGRPVPKIIDFGIAKATGQGIGVDTALTQFGQLVGTLEYISPEQADTVTSECDTGSDVYSLGVVIYELLVGTVPFDAASLRKAGLVELLRIIREEEAPSMPAKLSQMGQTATDLAARRRTDPQSLRRQLKDELNWIVMKAVEKNRQRRYQSASELAADIRRHINSEPVLAGPATKFYRARKFLQRRRLAVLAALLVGVSLIGGLVSTAWEWRVAENRRLEAESQANNAREQSYIANLAAADLYLRSNEIVAARQRLLSCPNDLRGWEWKHLLLKTDFSLATLYYNSDSDTPSFYGVARPRRQHRNLFAFSGDGGRIFSATQHTLYSWDASTYLPVGRWNSLGSIIAVSPHGNRILTEANTKGGADADHTLRIIDTSSHRQLTTFSHHRSEIAVAEFSADESLVATGDNRGGLSVWDTGSGEIVSELTTGGSQAVAIALSSEGKRIGAAFADKTVRVWDQGGRPRGPLISLNYDDPLAAIAFSPDCKRLATATFDHDIRVWDATTGRRQLEVTDFEGQIRSVRFGPDGSTIVVGLDQGVVQIRSAEAGNLLGSLSGNEHQVEAIGFHPDGRILTASAGKIRVWDARSFGGVRNIPSRANLVAFSPNGRVLASAGGDSIQLWDASSGKALGVLKTPLPFLRSIAFSPDGSNLACGSGDATIRIWNVASQTLARVLKLDAPGDPPTRRIVLSVSFSPDGSHLASGSDDGIVRFWEVSTGILLRKMSVSDPVDALAFSPDGRHIVTGTGDPSAQQPLHASAVRVWDATSGQLLVSTKSPPLPSWMAKAKEGDFGHATSVMYANDGGHIVANESYLGPIMWEAGSGRLSFRFKTSGAGGGWLAMDPEGRRLFGGGAGVQIWATRSGEPLFILRQPDQIWNLALSSDGTRLATASTERIRIWNTESAYNLEAESLVQSLFAKLYFAHDVIDALRKDQKLDGRRREAALLLVQQMGERPPQLHIQQAWDAVKSQGAAREALDLALRRAQLARDLAPWSWEAFNTLGAVQYRLGAYEDANTSLLHAAELRGDPSVTNLAFRALTLTRLGNSKEARSALSEAKRLIDVPNTAFGPEVVAIVEEAGAAIERQVMPSSK